MGHHDWVHSPPYSVLPKHVVLGGNDVDGSPIYVGRAMHEGENLPAKIVPTKGCAYVSWGGVEHSKTYYEFLTGRHYCWVHGNPGTIQHNAVRTGTTQSGEPLYVGRALYAGSQCVGKVHVSHACIYIPFNGEEIRLHNFEVLIKH